MSNSVYRVGSYGELCFIGLGAMPDEKSAGYPVFRTYSDKPGIKHACSRFIQESDAEAFAALKNSST